jgi:hypothetical protein
MAPRCAGMTASAAPPSGSDQDALAPGSVGRGRGSPLRGPHLREDIPDDPGSCSVAISEPAPTMGMRRLKAAETFGQNVVVTETRG